MWQTLRFMGGVQILGFILSVGEWSWDVLERHNRWFLAKLCDSLAASMNLGYASYEMMGTGKSLR